MVYNKIRYIYDFREIFLSITLYMMTYNNFIYIMNLLKMQLSNTPEFFFYFPIFTTASSFFAI